MGKFVDVEKILEIASKTRMDSVFPDFEKWNENMKTIACDIGGAYKAIIESLPTIEIINCEDCKYRTIECNSEEWWYGCNRFEHDDKCKTFCSLGERKEK